MFTTGYGLRDADLPSFEFLLDGQPASPVGAAHHLGVTLRTMRNWQAAGDAPRAAKLAMFYETRWGRSLIDTQMYNDNSLGWQTARALEREKAALLGKLARLEKLGGFGAANAPLYAVTQRPARLLNAFF